LVMPGCAANKGFVLRLEQASILHAVDTDARITKSSKLTIDQPQLIDNHE
jgi:hypothetical protein